MLRIGLVCAGLLALIPSARSFAQLPDQQQVESEQPASDPSVEFGPWPEESQPPSAEAEAADVPTDVDLLIEAPCDDPLIEAPCANPPDEFPGYRWDTASLGWIVGGGDQLGMFSLEWDHYQPSGENTGIGAGMKFHFLNGPERTEMPPRLFDFSIGGQSRKRLGEFGYDVAASVMASSDFEGNSREGIRFPSHAVGFMRVTPTIELVFGIDYLHRGDVKLLPVAGLILLPHPDLRFEVVFPRPRVVFRLTDEHRLFVRGELGGGTWAIEREARFDDLATYRDLRVSIGLECIEKKGRRSAFEIAYLFDRRLEYTSGLGDYHLDDTAMIRLTQSY